MDFGQETFYFCSEHCLHAFEVDPDGHPDDHTGQPAAAHVHQP
jgi:YHS domain-containing protein